MAYKSWIIDAIITLFMFLAGANFALHYKILSTDRKSLIRDPEFRFYTLIVLSSTAIIILWGDLEGRSLPQDPAGRLSGGLHHDHNWLCYNGLRSMDGSSQVHAPAAHDNRCMRRFNWRSH